MILQTIQKRLVDNVVINISPPNIFPDMLLTEKFHRNCQAAFFSHYGYQRVKQCTKRHDTQKGSESNNVTSLCNRAS